MYGIKLVVMLIVVGGLIAYVGDKIGMKIGRKRLSLFGLRPKYTSILITIVTGILIAISSLLLLMVASEEVRMALFDMQALLERLDQLNEQLSNKNNKLLELQADIQNKVASLTALRADKEDLNRQLTTIEDEYQETKESKVKLESKVEQLDQQKEDLTKQVDNLAYNIKLFGKKYLNSLTGDIIYQRGEIITSKSILANKSVEDIKGQVKELLKQSQRVAQNKGLQPKQEKSKINYNADEFNQVVDILKNRDDKVIIRLLAAKNTLDNEELAVKFDLYKDYKVYQEGTTVFMAKLDQVENLTQLEEELNQLLGKLKQKVVRDGILPDNQGQVGSLSLVHLYPIMDQLLAADSGQKIKIVATKDVWRNDKLLDNIKFVLKD